MFEGDQVYYANQNFNQGHNDGSSPIEIARKFEAFIKNWNVQNEFIYRDQLIKNGSMNDFSIRVSLLDLEYFDFKLSVEIRSKPFTNLPVLEKAAKELYLSFDLNRKSSDVPDFQVQFISSQEIRRIRNIKSEDIGKIVSLTGIIIKSSRVLLKARKIVLQCKKCKHLKELDVDHGFVSMSIPVFCERPRGIGPNVENCPRDSYQVLSDKCEFVDFQTLKLQEHNDAIPTGEIPRTYQLCVERYLVDQLIPGNRVSITGVYAVMERNTMGGKSAVAMSKVPYIYVLGFDNETSAGRSFNPHFTQAEEAKFLEMSKDPDIFNKLCRSVAPSIFGHEDVKKAITCLLFSGSRKILPDKTKLRGDINVLLWGDPSTAKSQLLKFVHKLFPISIYTSGKGSSAAGLTAAITKDNTTKEFQLEGGALVLADGGIVCIDEFDKMRAQDRVAIHEAMEQQTISIAKAGITTVLNSRTAILAAANPIFGSFNDLKSYSEQMDLQTTILSRFDCIFTIRDDKSAQNNERVATHILNTHLRGNVSETVSNAEVSMEDFRKYLMFARSRCSPRLTEESAITLQNEYVDQRAKSSTANVNRHGHIPITVRQLEAIIRLSEAIAKSRLAADVSKQDAQKAREIFEESTMKSIKSEKIFAQVHDKESLEEIQRAEDIIKSKMPVGRKISQQQLFQDLAERNINSMAIKNAVLQMIQREELVQSNKSDVLIRKK